MGNKQNRSKKTQKEVHRYKNMVKCKTEDENTDSSAAPIEDLQGTNETIDNITETVDKNEPRVQEPPLSYKAKEFFESNFTQILITVILGIAGWSMMLQIGQAVQDEKINNIEEDMKEIKTVIDNKYIIKDLYDIQTENIKDKINKLENEIDNLKK